MNESAPGDGARRAPAPAKAAAPAAIPRAGFVGSDACAGCHAREYEAWRGSQHHRAMQHADDRSVLGNFDGARITHAGRVTTFQRQDQKFWVTTDGPDGKPTKYRVLYTFGVEPLQQYLVPFEGGRLQALPFAWDTRPKKAGGQRWYHLYPREAQVQDDVLYWTRPAQNYNHMCAECHSTNVVKGYDPATDRFQTSSAEMGVGCEACHAGGARHVAWARTAQPDPTRGLDVAFHDRRGSNWIRTPGSKHAARSSPRPSQTEIETCAYCHGRRVSLAQPFRPGTPLLDNVAPDLLMEGLYAPDGIMQEEVFTYGSFVQSKMAARGVTCSDCHNPHSGDLVAQGNTLCSQCHDAAYFDRPAHTHHLPASRGDDSAVGCVSCHMPARSYMGHDVRHDHGFRVPRPDLSVLLGIPNACNDCHRDEDARWAAASVVSWLGRPARGSQTYAETFARAREGDASTSAALEAIVSHPGTPEIVRASALVYRARLPGGMPPELLQNAARDESPLVRRATASALEGLAADEALRLARPLLDDPVLAVRIEAGARLAFASGSGLAASEARLLESAVEEYRASQLLHADRVEAQNNLGLLFSQLGASEQAQRAYQRALAIEPAYVPSYVNLADLYRELGRDAEGERLLRAGLARAPEDPELLHSLGLALVRRGKARDALERFERAARLEPGNQQFQLVYETAKRELR